MRRDNLLLCGEKIMPPALWGSKLSQSRLKEAECGSGIYKLGLKDEPTRGDYNSLWYSLLPVHSQRMGEEKQKDSLKQLVS